MNIQRPPISSYLNYANQSRTRRVLLVALAFFACTFFTCGMSLLIYVAALPNPTNILVLGVDARSGEGYVTRTDSIMLLGFKPRELRGSLLSVPRDLFISVPNYGVQRVNTINMLGEMDEAGTGPELLKASFNQSFGVEVDKYIRLNFSAFEALIDAVGGVTINVERRVYDPNYPTPDYGVETVVFEVGEQHMDGASALKYARTRHSDDDYYRAGRQQQVMSAFGRKLLNPFNWPAVTAALVSHVDTDMNVFTVIKIAPVVLVNAGDFDRLVINRDYITPISGGASPDYAKLAPWISARFK